MSLITTSTSDEFSVVSTSMTLNFQKSVIDFRDLLLQCTLRMNCDEMTKDRPTVCEQKLL